MIVLTLIIIAGLWLAFGFLVWRTFIRKRIATPVVRGIALVGFLAVWMVGPWLDEILGVQRFERFCAEMPPIKFYGPVVVGPGAFFDTEGRAKFSERDDLSGSLGPFGKGFEKLFATRDEWKQVATFPIPIYDNPVTHFDKRNGQTVVVKPYRASPGGWIKRATGWGYHAPLVCPVLGEFPKTAQWVRFQR
jgi:hypothetical protein